MNRAISLGLAGLITITGSIAFAQATKEDKPATPPAGMPEMTPEQMQMMQACIEAGTPGEMQEWLMEAVGVWDGKNTMWMGPDAPPMQSTCVSTITPMMEGRYIKCEMTGDMAEMGTFNGFGIQGFDNVSQQFQGSWVDNHSTGIMTGVGERSSDGKTLTWKYTYNCPITKKPAVMREIERRTSPNTMEFEMWGTDPVSGKEYKMMLIEFTRRGGATPSATGNRATTPRGAGNTR